MSLRCQYTGLTKPFSFMHDQLLACQTLSLFGLSMLLKSILHRPILNIHSMVRRSSSRYKRHTEEVWLPLLDLKLAGLVLFCSVVLCRVSFFLVSRDKFELKL